MAEKTLEQQFHIEMKGTDEVARERGYVATYFLQMLEEYGGVETAKRLLAKPEAQTGLHRLWELELLHESMEALVVKEHFQPLFTESEVAEARRRLEELDYFK